MQDFKQVMEKWNEFLVLEWGNAELKMLKIKSEV